MVGIKASCMSWTVENISFDFCKIELCFIATIGRIFGLSNGALRLLVSVEPLPCPNFWSGTLSSVNVFYFVVNFPQCLILRCGKISTPLLINLCQISDRCLSYDISCLCTLRKFFLRVCFGFFSWSL